MHNSIAYTLELRLSCTKPLICEWVPRVTDVIFLWLDLNCEPTIATLVSIYVYQYLVKCDPGGQTQYLLSPQQYKYTGKTFIKSKRDHSYSPWQLENTSILDSGHNRAIVNVERKINTFNSLRASALCADWALCSTVCWDLQQWIKKALHCWPLWGESIGNQWIHLTKGQQWRRCFHVMASSCYNMSLTPPLHKEETSAIESHTIDWQALYGLKWLNFHVCCYQRNEDWILIPFP